MLVSYETDGMLHLWMLLTEISENTGVFPSLPAQTGLIIVFQVRSDLDF